MSTNRSEISTYFGKTVSGFVANKFRVDISAMNMETLRFYVKKVSIPYETLNFSEDIYVSATTLARPRNVISVQTPSEVSFTFRMDPENSIIKKLQSLFYSTHNNNTFEVTKNPRLFTISITLYGSDLIEKYKRILNNCSLVKMESYDLDASDRKLKEYSVTFVCNRIRPSDYASTSTTGNATKAIISCQKLLTDYKAALAAFQDSLNMSKNTSTALTIEDVDTAFSDSNVISLFYNLVNNSAVCRFDEKFPLGWQFEGPIKDYVYKALIRNGIPPDRIATIG